MTQRILLVEPKYRKGIPKKSPAKARNDETLWYPPIGLMKLATYHKNCGDEVRFVRGCDSSIFSNTELLCDIWDRVYITTLFTFHFKEIVKTIRFYLEAVGGTISKIFVGGIMSSLMADDIFEETGVYPIPGILTSPRQIRLDGDTNIDLLPPDYDLLDADLYAINNTYYAYTTRGCPVKCPWCGVPSIEPEYDPYIDIKPVIRQLRDRYGDKSTLKLMDNNVLESPELGRIVEDLLELGYGGKKPNGTQPKKLRVIDFNQGLEASSITEKNMELLGQLNIKPMRIAFDRVKDEDAYVRAIELAHKSGVPEFSNYMLYNFWDTPRDLYERLAINIRLNEKWIDSDSNRITGNIYSYPMRYAPIHNTGGKKENRKRDLIQPDKKNKRDWLHEPIWTKRFIRNIEIMKGAAHGAISPTPTLAWRTIGKTFEEFLANLYMPEELLRNRNKHEKKVYPYEPRREPGTGKVEGFRSFILRLLTNQDEKFHQFHKIVSDNSVATIRKALPRIKDRRMKEWLELYVEPREESDQSKLQLASS